MESAGRIANGKARHPAQHFAKESLPNPPSKWHWIAHGRQGPRPENEVGSPFTNGGNEFRNGFRRMLAIAVQLDNHVHTLVEGYLLDGDVPADGTTC